jgi:hypothetical protein
VFKYHCPACGIESFSSASSAAVGGCPSCGSPLADDGIARAPEPDALPRRRHVDALRPRAAVDEAIDVVRWQWEHLWAVVFRRPWPPRVHPDTGPVPKRTRSGLAAIQPARAWSVGALCVAALLVGAVLLQSDSQPTASRPPAAVLQLVDYLPQTKPVMRVQLTRAHKNSTRRRASRGSRPSRRARTKAHRQERSRRQGRSRARAASPRVRARQQSGDRLANRQASPRPGGRRPPVHNPASSSPNPAPQQPSPAVVTSPTRPAAPAPAPPPPPPASAPTDSRPDARGGGRPAHPHGGPPGQSRNHGAGR